MYGMNNFIVTFQLTIPTDQLFQLQRSGGGFMHSRITRARNLILRHWGCKDSRMHGAIIACWFLLCQKNAYLIITRKNGYSAGLRGGGSNTGCYDRTFLPIPYFFAVRADPTSNWVLVRQFGEVRFNSAEGRDLFNDIFCDFSRRPLFKLRIPRIIKTTTAINCELKTTSH